jgi:hypothetical protein
MTKVEEREVINEALYNELIEKYDSNIEYYIQNIDESAEDILSELDEMHLYDYVEDLVENKVDFLIKKYNLILEDGELNIDLIEPIYVEYIEKFVNDMLPFREAVLYSNMSSDKIL